MIGVNSIIRTQWKKLITWICTEAKDFLLELPWVRKHRRLVRLLVASLALLASWLYLDGRISFGELEEELLLTVLTMVIVAIATPNESDTRKQESDGLEREGHKDGIEEVVDAGQGSAES